MSDGLRLDIEPPLAGWATVRLTVPGVGLEFVASYTPRDSISELAQAAVGLLVGLPEQVVAWNTEPVEYEFQFAVAGDQTRLKVHQYPDSRRRWRHVETPVASVEGDTLNIVRVVWRRLRRLQGTVSAEAFAAAWGHPFPASTIQRIGEQLRDQAKGS
jgi:hypothetical protein